MFPALDGEGKTKDRTGEIPVTKACALLKSGDLRLPITRRTTQEQARVSSRRGSTLRCGGPLSRALPRYLRGLGIEHHGRQPPVAGQTFVF